MSEHERWIKASDAYERLSPAGSNPAAVEQMIAAYLRNGQLKARAKAIWSSTERFTKDAWKSRPVDAEGGDIPTRYWRYEKAVHEDRSQWRFICSRMLVTVTLRPRRRIMMKGVEFSLNDLAKLQPKTFGKMQGVKAKRGRPADIKRRDDGWMALLELIVDKHKFKNKTALAEKLKEDLGKNPEKTGPGDTGIEEIARQAWQVAESVLSDPAN